MNHFVLHRWVVVLLLCATTARAEVPPPANDTTATAQVLGTVPAIVTGTNVRGSDTLSVTTLPGLTSVPGPDVFYRFTPGTSGDYWVTMIPWIQVPVYGSSGGTAPVPNLCVYVRRVSDGVFIAGSDANPRGRADTAVATLAAGIEYEIVIDSTETAPRGQEFEFTLVVAAAPDGLGDDCVDLGTVSAGLPTAVADTLSGAANDIDLMETPGICDVALTPIVPGADRVYSFMTGPDPNDAGTYVFSLVPGGDAWDGVVYITDSCPPFFLLGCLGAANHTASPTRQSETIVADLEFDTEYFVVVDANTFSLTDPKFTLLIDRAASHGFTEVEVNDTPGLATTLAVGGNGGQLAGPEDVDYWAVPAAGGERLYAFLDNGNVTLSGLDVELRLFDTDGTSLIEFDDDDGEGSESDLATFYRRSSSFSAVIAGATLPAAGTYFLEASNDQVSTVARYRLHVGIQPAGRAPAPECDRNDTPGFADLSAKNWFSGAITAQGDIDTYAFDALAGERIFIALDGDPERDSGGDDADDPLALDAALVVIDPDGDTLLSDHDDVNAVGQIPDYPAEGLIFVAPLSGTYHVQVAGGDPLSDFGPGRTYELAIFRNDATPVLSEGTDPAIDSLVPDFMNDSIAVAASDDAAGDSGICSVQLAPGSSNLALAGVSFTPGDPTVAFSIELATPGQSGSGKLVIIDCAGNTACAAIDIDAGTPSCTGSIVTPGTRVFESRHAPLHAPDNQPSGPGIDGTIDIDLGGTIADLNVTVTAETSRLPDIDVFLESPAGTRVDVVSDRGSISAFNLFDATFDDAAAGTISILDDEPYTGTWLPDDALGLAQFNGESVSGAWKLNLRDDASTSTGGSRLVRWSLEIDAGFANPQQYQGNASDSGGIQSIELVDPNNVLLTVAPFTPGDASVDFTITLVDPSSNGAATVLVTDVSDNTCSTLVTLAGLPDNKPPLNEGGATRNLQFGREAQLSVPPADPGGVVSTFTVPESVTVAAVVVDLTINTLDIGRLAATLAHDGQFASLINRVGMDERGSVGRTKDNLEITLDDDAPVADDAHLEPALGSESFLGLHQPDGRGEFVGDGIDLDNRDNMLFAFEGTNAAGDWDLFVGDFRIQGGGIRSEFRRWSATVIAPGAPERYVGTARDTHPESGICALTLSGGSTNLVVDANFTPADAEVAYTVALLDPNLPGTGLLEIEDCAGNITAVPISLAPRLPDQNLPSVSGGLNTETLQFEGTAGDDAPGDSGIVSIELAPWSDNLQLVAVDPLPAGTANFVVARSNLSQNARGYVRVTDAVGFRRHLLVTIDALAPVCTSSVTATRRYFSGPVDAPLPDAGGAGVTSNIVVPDFDVIADVDLTINITHPFDDDIDLRLVAPSVISLFSDIGSTGNDFRDTTLDDEAAIEIPDSFSAAPFTGSYRPEAPATLSVLDGGIAAGTYALQIIDDAGFNEGVFNNWSLVIESATFPERYDGRAEDSGTHDAGVCTVELVGAANLVLTVDPAFVPGDGIVRFSLERLNEALDGSGTVRVTDCAGNFCEEVVCLVANMPPAASGDLDGDGEIDPDDLTHFAGCLLGPDVDADADACGPCRLADFDTDGDVDLLDVLSFQTAFGG